MDKERPINDLSLLEYFLLQNNQDKYYYFARTKQPNEFQYQSTHQDLLHNPQLLFRVNYL